MVGTMYEVRAREAKKQSLADVRAMGRMWRAARAPKIRVYSSSTGSAVGVGNLVSAKGGEWIVYQWVLRVHIQG